MNEDQKLAILELVRTLKDYVKAMEWLPNEITPLLKAIEKVESEFAL